MQEFGAEERQWRVEGGVGASKIGEEERFFFFPGFCFVRWVFFLGGGGSDRGVLKG